MIRMLIFLVTVVFIAAGVTALIQMDGFVDAQIGDYAISFPVVAMAIGALLLAGISIFGTLVTSWFAGLPKRVRRKKQDVQRSRGMIALARGLEAVAAGDASDAQRHAKNATKNLNEPGLTRFLTAQAAQLSGDHQVAEENFAGMLEAPETEFLGLKGLYLQAANAGDKAAAKEYADRAFRLRPGAPWAFDSVYQLSLERGAWGEALNALQLAQKNGGEKNLANARREAALLTAAAYAADASADSQGALKEALAAHKIAPEFTPAAVLIAKLLGAKGNASKASRILEEAWAAAPHPAITNAMEVLFADAPAGRRAGRLLRLAEKAPDQDESRLVRAEQHLVLEDYDAAIQDLTTLVSRNPSARTFSAMATAMTGKYDEKAGRPWLTKAASAPLDTNIGRDGEFHFTTDGWRRLVEEFAVSGQLAPPPLENISFGMTRDEIKLLTAVAAKPKPVAPKPVAPKITERKESEPQPNAPVKISEKAIPVTDKSTNKQTVQEKVLTAPAADYVVPSKKS